MQGQRVALLRCVGFLRAYDIASQSRADFTEYINGYNTKRGHASIEDQMPDQANWKRLPSLQIAA